MSSQNVPGDSVFDEVDPGPVSTSPGTVELIARHDYNKGALEVTVVRARLKEDAVWNQDDMKHQTTIGRRTIDPYVKVALGGTTLTTKVASKTYTPMFNDTFQFDSENITYDSVLHVKVKIFRMIHKDSLIGELTLHLGDLDMGKVQQFPLKAPQTVSTTEESRGTDLNTSKTEETDTQQLVSTTDGSKKTSAMGSMSSLFSGFMTSKVKDLHTAALVGDIGKVNKFLETGHDVNEKKIMQLFPEHSDEVVSEHQFQDVTPLHCAVIAGNAKVVSRLLRAGADPLVRSKDLQSPMHAATWFGQDKIMETLLLKYELEYQQNMKQKGVTGPLSTSTARLLYWVDPTIRADLENMVWEAAKVDNVAFLNVLVGQLEWTVEDLTIRDPAGNTPLHYAVDQRYQSKKFAQALLDMNSDLLQEKNSKGQTVLNVAGVDMKYTLMGTAKRVGSLKSDSHFEEDSLGYRVYAKTVADILTDESTTMPITVGIYARWGTGKSFILNQVKNEIDANIEKADKLRHVEEFNAKITTKRDRKMAVPPLPYASCASILTFLLFILTVVGGALSYFYYRAIFKIILIVGTISTICMCVIVGYLKRKYLTRILLTLFPDLRVRKRHLQLIGIWLDLLAPPNLETNLPNPGHVKVIHVQFNAWEYSGCSALWAGIVTKLCDEVEATFGPWTTRLYRAIHDKFMASERPPVTGRLWFKLLIGTILGTVLIVLASVFGISGESTLEIATSIFQILCGVVLSAGFMKNATEIWSFLRKMAISQRDRLMAQTTKPNFDQELGFMAKVKTEVQVITYLLRYFEAARGKQYRVVVVVDDLDRCPKDRVTKVIEAVGILLSDPNSHFISLLAVDPRIVVKSIEESFGDVMRNANINGYEYLKKMVQLPICLPGPGAEERKRFLWDTAKMSATERKVMAVQRQEAGQARAKEAAKTLVLNKEERDALKRGLHKLSILWRDDKTQETSLGCRRVSVVSSSEEPGLDMTGNDITDKNLYLTEAIKSLQKDDVIRYVAGNPRHIRRLFNILCVSVGVLSQRERLTRFTPKQVARWVLLVEQWPYRMSWIIQYVEDFFQRRELGRRETLQRGIQMHDKLVDIFLQRVKCEITTQEEWSHLNPLDEDPEMFELFLTFAKFTVEDMQDLLPYTVNLDLSIRQTVGYARAQTDVKEVEQTNQTLTSLLNQGESPVSLDSTVALLSELLRKGRREPGITKTPDSVFSVEQETDDRGSSSPQARAETTTPGRRPQVRPHGNHSSPDPNLDVIAEESAEEVCRDVQRQLSAAMDDSTVNDDDDEPAMVSTTPMIADAREMPLEISSPTIVTADENDEKENGPVLGQVNGHSSEEDVATAEATATSPDDIDLIEDGERNDTDHDDHEDDESPLLEQPPTVSNGCSDDVYDEEENLSAPLLDDKTAERESNV
ncbi:kinase D-interacting substrate of 220 kDa B-like [Branchiostoma floridae]|uniref:Kinase D-interacting substrate of 220 kDa B-like n=1 Tax=Branchiostoma floridae TaxID=7739 RepID=A0A9J7LIF3_BRAFL|nr:kinase D-interacting substrate of 220 kDa B-like [Branchiostoma floridae]